MTAPAVPEIVKGKRRQIAVDRLVPHPHNPRKGSVDELKRIITASGFRGELQVQESTLHVLVGNHRLKAARELGMARLPCLLLDVTDAEAEDILLQDNRASDLASYDRAALANLLATRDPLGLPATGFSEDAAAALVARYATPDPGGAEVTYPVPPPPPVGQYGVVVRCTDATHQQAVYERLTAEGLECKVVVV